MNVTSARRFLGNIVEVGKVPTHNDMGSTLNNLHIITFTIGLAIKTYVVV